MGGLAEIMRNFEKLNRMILRLLALYLIYSYGNLISPLLAESENEKVPRRPNIIMILADDMGYGDLGSYGHPTIRTPNLDRLAQEGQKWTGFYAAANVCTPSRAALMTGRWPVRSGMASDRRYVLTARAAGGLPVNEITIAEGLQESGYATACVGKWHLGHLPQYLPTRAGFDSFFGTPYSNDEIAAKEWRSHFRRRDYWKTPLFYDPRSEYWDVPLMRDETIIERPVSQENLTKRYIVESQRFIREKADRPFFLYLSFNMPHVPLFASEEFRGRSERGIYGDVIEELDWGVGEIVETLKEEGLSEDTLIVFSSDNGPWLVFDQHGGSAGLLRDGKGSTWEGGHRVPGIFWWPGQIEPQVVSEIGSLIDLFPTFMSFAGASLPNDRVIDGVDLSSRLRSEASSARKSMLFFRGTKVLAYRNEAFKAHLKTKNGFGLSLEEIEHEPAFLVDLGVDPGERYNVAEQNWEALEDIMSDLDREKSSLSYGKDQLVEQLPAGRP